VPHWQGDAISKMSVRYMVTRLGLDATRSAYFHREKMITNVPSVDKKYGLVAVEPIETGGNASVRAVTDPGRTARNLGRGLSRPINDKSMRI